MRDIPKNVSDRKLLETFQKFGEISAITMDRHQSVRQQQWLKHKEFESKLAQKNELNKTIKKLKQKMKKNMINDYQVWFAYISLLLCLLHFHHLCTARISQNTSECG